MNACPLDVLHDTGNQHILTVRDDVDLNLGAAHVFVDEDRVVDTLGQYAAHVGLNFVLVVDYLHVMPADDV